MSLSDTAKRERFRAYLTGATVLHPASVFDALSARAAEDAGFETAMLAGSVASLAVLGAPDIVVLTLSELAEQCRRICRATDLPLLVDADHGFGNAMSAQRTVHELEAAGVSAITIEDTLLPKPFGGAAAKLIPVEEAAGKVRAAVAGRRDPLTVIVGRTNLAHAPLNEAVTRVRAFAEADAIFLSSPKTRAQIEAISAATDLPLILGRITPELDDRAYLEAHRVRIVLQGHKPFMAAVHAAAEVLALLRAGTKPADIPRTAEPALVDRLSRREAYNQLEAATLAARKAGTDD